MRYSQIAIIACICSGMLAAAAPTNSKQRLTDLTGTSSSTKSVQVSPASSFTAFEPDQIGSSRPVTVALQRAKAATLRGLGTTGNRAKKAANWITSGFGSFGGNTPTVVRRRDLSDVQIQDISAREVGTTNGSKFYASRLSKSGLEIEDLD